MTIITQEHENEQQFSGRVKDFFRRYQIGDILRKCNAYKHSGVPVVAVVSYLFCLVFRNRSMYLDMSSDRKGCAFGRDTVYRLKNSVRINWERFTTLLSARIITESLQPAVSEKRRDVFIVDDTIFERNRSRSVELLAWKYDHAKHRTIRGFQLLTLNWSDGVTQIPVNYCLTSAAKADKRINEAQIVSAGSAGGRRRRLAQMEKPDVVPFLLKEALKAKISAQYVLFDSWYCIPKLIYTIKQIQLHTVAMVKRGSKQYVCNGRRMNCKEIFAANRKRRGRSKYLLSVDVEMPYQPDKHQDEIMIPVKLVYVRNRNKRNEYLLLLSTDLNLSEEEIIQLYGKRWNIEVFFKTCKSVLKLAGECRSISYDAMCAQTAIVFARYMLLALEARREQDPRTAGPLFCLICDEIADVTFQQALAYLQQFWEILLQAFPLPEQRITALFLDFMASLPVEVAAMLAFVAGKSSLGHVSGCEV